MIKLRFKLVEGVRPSRFELPEVGGSLVAEVEGWAIGDVYMATSRLSPKNPRGIIDYKAVFWSQALFEAALTVPRATEVIAAHALKQGFHVTVEGDDLISFRRPGFGLLPTQRQMTIRSGGREWIYRSTSPFATTLLAGSEPRARFTAWSTHVAVDLTPVEMVIVLTIVTQRLWLATSWYIARAMNLNFPRGGGDRYSLS